LFPSLKNLSGLFLDTILNLFINESLGQMDIFYEIV
jgi:hypothetical protein